MAHEKHLHQISFIYEQQGVSQHVQDYGGNSISSANNQFFYASKCSFRKNVLRKKLLDFGFVLFVYLISHLESRS